MIVWLLKEPSQNIYEIGGKQPFFIFLPIFLKFLIFLKNTTQLSIKCFNVCSTPSQSLHSSLVAQTWIFRGLQTLHLQDQTRRNNFSLGEPTGIACQQFMRTQMPFIYYRSLYILGIPIWISHSSSKTASFAWGRLWIRLSVLSSWELGDTLAEWNTPSHSVTCWCRADPLNFTGTQLEPITLAL